MKMIFTSALLMCALVGLTASLEDKINREKDSSQLDVYNIPGCGTRSINFTEHDTLPGNIQLAIAGGVTVASDKKWPWMAGIYSVYPKGIEWFHCGGVIISPFHVVSAAHCFRKSQRPEGYCVRVGSTKKYAGPRLSIQHIRLSSLYRMDLSYNDIAVLKLAKPLIFQDNVRPICIAPIGTYNKENSLAGEEVTAIGWGVDQYKEDYEELQEVTLQVVDLKTCSAAYSVVKSSKQPLGITSGQLCAGVPEGGKDTCRGDSGGPLMCNQNDVWMLVGITSFGKMCAEKDYPGVYTRISSYDLNLLTED